MTVLDAGLSTLKSFFVNFELYCGEMSGGGRPETMVEQENRRETREDAKKRRPQTESLNRITKCPLDTAEYHNPPQEYKATHSEADTQLPAFHNAGPEKGVAKAFDDRHHGIQHQNPTPFVRHAGKRVKNATGIHPELDAESDEQREIFIPCGEGRNETTNPDSE